MHTHKTQWLIVIWSLNSSQQYEVVKYTFKSLRKWWFESRSHRKLSWIHSNWCCYYSIRLSFEYRFVARLIDEFGLFFLLLYHISVVDPHLSPLESTFWQLGVYIHAVNSNTAFGEYLFESGKEEKYVSLAKICDQIN